MSAQKKQGHVKEVMKKAMKLAEFAIIALIAWGISDSVKNSLLASGFSYRSL
jgi:hypothetical protein